MDKKEEKATFAGGCFWCMQPIFKTNPGVLAVNAGYTGGKKKDPAYEKVSSGTTGHVEAVEVTYDPAKTKYQDLLDIFWANIDPTDAGGQFADRGSQYKSAIFYHNEEQRKAAEESLVRLGKSGKYDKPIMTRVLTASEFYEAEEYHQDYYRKEPQRYELYKKGSGREAYIERMKEKEKELLKKGLTPMQYHVTQECGTEPPFKNEYWDNKQEGIYVDRVSGEALFSSKDKFESGTGWPSFTKPLEENNVIEKNDKTLGMERTEVKSKKADSHLGHIFQDGPQPTGLRYCINSASLRFIPKKDLEKEGYGKYKSLFEK